VPGRRTLESAAAIELWKGEGPHPSGALSLDSVCACSGAAALAAAPPEAPCTKPQRSTLRGENLILLPFWPDRWKLITMRQSCCIGRAPKPLDECQRSRGKTGTWPPQLPQSRKVQNFPGRPARGDGESALRDSLPVERACNVRRCRFKETLDSRRPLIPRTPDGVSTFAACRTFHPAGPPLEPQGGRLHNLLRIARMNRELLLYFKASGARQSLAASTQPRSSPIGEHTLECYPSASDPMGPPAVPRHKLEQPWIERSPSGQSPWATMIRST
jgi:hypothetical protein